VTAWWALLRETIALTLRLTRRPAMVLAVLTVAQTGVIAGLGISQLLLVDGSSAGDRGTVLIAIVLGASAYAVSATAGWVCGNLTLYVVGRVRTGQNERLQHLISSIPTIGHLEHGPYIDRWNRIFQNSQAIAALPWSTLNTLVATAGLGRHGRPADLGEPGARAAGAARGAAGAGRPARERAAAGRP
jgi:ATP-binding cassette, subfamily B, bacterial